MVVNIEGEYGVRCYCGRTLIEWAPSEEAFLQGARALHWSPNAEGQWRCPEHVFATYEERGEQVRNKKKIRELENEIERLEEDLETWRGIANANSEWLDEVEDELDIARADAEDLRGDIEHLEHDRDTWKATAHGAVGALMKVTEDRERFKYYLENLSGAYKDAVEEFLLMKRRVEFLGQVRARLIKRNWGRGGSGNEGSGNGGSGG